MPNPIAAGDGKVFLTVSSGGIYQTLSTYDAATGRFLWSKSLRDEITGASLRGSSPPAFHDGTIYWTLSGSAAVEPPASPAAVHAYDATTGTQVFQTPIRTQSYRFGAPIIVGGKVYADIAFYGGLRAFDATTGNNDWFVDLPQQHQWTAAADDRNLYIYFGSAGVSLASLYAIDRSRGVIEYTIRDNASTSVNHDPMMGNPLLGTHNDAFAINQGRLIRFDLGERKISWEKPGAYVSGLALADQSLFAVNSGRLEILDSISGELLWDWKPTTDNLLGSNVVLTDSHIFVSGGIRTYAVNRDTKLVDWSLDESGWRLALSGQMAVYPELGR